MKRMLLILSLVMVSSGLYASTSYYASINQVTPFKISSGTCQGYNVGSSTINVKTVDEHKDLLIENVSGSILVVGFTQTFSTGTFTNGQECGFVVPVGSVLRFEKFYGNLWMRNDGNGTNEVRVMKVKNVK